MANKETQPRRKSNKNALTGGERVVLGLGIPAILVGGVFGGYALYKHENPDKSNSITQSEPATPTPSEAGDGVNGFELFLNKVLLGTTEGTSLNTPTSVESNVEVTEGGIPVPAYISGNMVRELREGGVNPMYKEGEWFHPVYDSTQEDEAHDYRGIGPWYPVAFENLDTNAAVLTSHGNVGELIVSGRNGGMVMVAFMQLDAHQTDGAWGTDQATGKFLQNPEWAMQYNFHSLAPLQEILVVDPDTGEQLLWPDGSPVIYRANEDGIAAFAIPKTDGQDVRVGFVFNMHPAIDGVQYPEVKIERGPNDRPGLTGENPLPDSVLKPMVTER
jgi:hypothetical protein